MSVLMPPDAADSKLRGGYYTPPAIARFLADWAIRSAETELLEPSCGDGELLEAAVCRLLTLGATPERIGTQVQGIEFYERVYEISVSRGPEGPVCRKRSPPARAKCLC